MGAPSWLRRFWREKGGESSSHTQSKAGCKDKQCGTSHRNVEARQLNRAAKRDPFCVPPDIACEKVGQAARVIPVQCKPEEILEDTDRQQGREEEHRVCNGVTG